MQKAAFGAGCFWGVEAVFQKIKGVKSTIVGYMGGDLKNPTYENVCSDQTNHAEVVQIKYDSKLITYEKLLEIFWKIHDPTQLNKQGLDIGTQYRSVIFYYDEEQKKLAEESKNKKQRELKNNKIIVTEITAAKVFYPAEEYHQKYFNKHNRMSCKL